MKKLLCLLSSFVICASPLSMVIACKELPYEVCWQNIKKEIEKKIAGIKDNGEEKGVKIQKFSVLKKKFTESNDFFSEIEGVKGIQGKTPAEKFKNVLIRYKNKQETNNLYNDPQTYDYEILVKLDIPSCFHIDEKPDENGFYKLDVKFPYKYITYEEIKQNLEKAIKNVEDFEGAKEIIDKYALSVDTKAEEKIKGLKTVKFKKVETFKNDKFEFAIDLVSDIGYFFENDWRKSLITIDTDVRSELLNKWFKFRVNIGSGWGYIWDFPFLKEVPGTLATFSYDSNEPDAKDYFSFRSHSPQLEGVIENSIEIIGHEIGQKHLIVKYGNSEPFKILIDITEGRPMRHFKLADEDDYKKTCFFNSINQETNLELSDDKEQLPINKPDIFSIDDERIRDKFEIMIISKNNKLYLNIRYKNEIKDENLKNGVISLFPYTARNGMNIKYQIGTKTNE